MSPLSKLHLLLGMVIWELPGHLRGGNPHNTGKRYLVYLKCQVQGRVRVPDTEGNPGGFKQVVGTRTEKKCLGRHSWCTGTALPFIRTLPSSLPWTSHRYEMGDERMEGQKR